MQLLGEFPSDAAAVISAMTPARHLMVRSMHHVRAAIVSDAVVWTCAGSEDLIVFLPLAQPTFTKNMKFELCDEVGSPGGCVSSRLDHALDS